MKLTPRGEAAAVIAAAVPVAGLLAADGRYRFAAVALCCGLAGVLILTGGWRRARTHRAYAARAAEKRAAA